MQPSSVDPVIRRAIRAVIRIETVPMTATENRHPNGVSPNVHCPIAIMILPSGGWATISPDFSRKFGLPWSSSVLTFLTWFSSTPCRRIEFASGT